MIASDKHKFLFIHIPRTGGTSLANMLFSVIGHDLHQIHHQHSAYQNLSHTEREKYKSYFKLAFVRNPIHRLISWYNLVNSSQQNLIDFYKTQTDPQFYFNQLDYISATNNQLSINEYYQMEDFDNEITHLSKRLNVNLQVKQHVNKKPALVKEQNISQKEIDFLAEKCQRDLEHFNYSIPKHFTSIETV